MTFRGCFPLFSKIRQIFSGKLLMSKTKLDETYIFKISIKLIFFNVTIGIKIPFFRVPVTIEPGRSLLQFVTTNCLILTRSSFLQPNEHAISILLQLRRKTSFWPIRCYERLLKLRIVDFKWSNLGPSKSAVFNSSFARVHVLRVKHDLISIS